MQKIKGELFKMGTQVEVTSNLKGRTNSWFKATITPPPNSNSPPSSKPRNQCLWVEYHTIFHDNSPSKKFQELTDISLIRPLPPMPTTKDTSNFEKFDFVDAYREGGWFTGVLLHVFDSELKYLVAFLHPYEEFVYGRDQIRVHFEWLGGAKWRKVYPSQKRNVTFCPPQVGETVVASVLESTPAVVSPVKQAPSLNKKVKLTTSGDAEGIPSSHPNYVLQSIDELQKFLQPCSLPSSKGDMNCNGKRKAPDEQNYSSWSFSPKNKIEGVELFKMGTQVEVTSNLKGRRNSWFKATIISNSSYKIQKTLLVQYNTIFHDDDPSKKFQEFTNISLIRPLPPIPTKDTTKFQKYDFVDAYHKDRWFTGVLLHVFNNGLNYLVAFLNPYEEFVYERDQIRGQMEWLGGAIWTKVNTPHKLKVDFCPPNVGETVVASVLESASAVVSPVEQPPSPAKKLKRTTSGDAEERASSDRNNAVQSLDAPQKIIQPCPLTSNVGNTHCNGKRKASDGKNYSSLSFSPNNEDMNKNDDSQSPSPAKRNLATKVVDVISEKVKVKDEQVDYGSNVPAAAEYSEACPVTTCFSPLLDESQSWPFTKKSEMWKVYESMEVFKRIPQTPHFSPLNEHEESTREKIALCMMTKLSYEAERISAGSPDDLNTSRIIIDTLKSLEEFESNGFNITPLQNYLTELLFSIEKEKELNGDLAEIETQITKCQDEKTKKERKLNELAKQLKSLQEQIQLEKSRKHLKDRQLATLESRRGIISEKLHSFQLTMKPAFKW